jgi:hypothetical protein
VFWTYRGTEEMTVRSYELDGFEHHRRRIYQPKMVDPANLRSKPALTASELKITLRVLRFLTHVKGLNPARPLQYAIDDIESQHKGAPGAAGR